MKGKDFLKCMEYIDDKLIEEALNPTIVSHKNKLAVKWIMTAACVVIISSSVIAFWSHQKNSQEHVDNNIVAQADAADKDSDQGNTGISTMTADDASTNTASVSDTENKEEQELPSKKRNSELLEGEVVEDLTDIYIIREYYKQKDASESCYSVPGKGTILCYHDLQETMNYYYTSQENMTDVIDNTVYAYQVVIDIYGDIDTANGIQYENLYHSDAGNLLIEREYRRLLDLGYAVRLSEDFQLTGIFTKIEIDAFSTAPEYGYVFRFENES